MSWFFGKKKNKESPPSTPEEPVPQDEGFIFIEERNKPDPDDKPPSLYPSLNDMSSYPAMPSSFAKQVSIDNQSHDLTSIPFKFSKELERKINEDLVIDKLRLDEIVSFIDRIKTDNYDYKFQLERSVINEMDSQTNE